MRVDITHKLQTTTGETKAPTMGYFRSTADTGVMMAEPQEQWTPVGYPAVLSCRMTSLKPYNVQRGLCEIHKALEHGWHGGTTVKTEICLSMFGTAESNHYVLHFSSCCLFLAIGVVMRKVTLLCFPLQTNRIYTETGAGWRHFLRGLMPTSMPIVFHKPPAFS